MTGGPRTVSPTNPLIRYLLHSKKQRLRTDSRPLVAEVTNYEWTGVSCLCLNIDGRCWHFLRARMVIVCICLVDVSIDGKIKYKLPCNSSVWLAQSGLCCPLGCMSGIPPVDLLTHIRAAYSRALLWNNYQPDSCYPSAQ